MSMALHFPDMGETDSRSALLSAVREFAERRIAPIASKVDEEDTIPPEFYREMNEQGLMSMLVPEEQGGLGLSTSLFAEVLEMISGYSGGIGLSLEAHNSLGLGHFSKYGSKELIKSTMPRILQSGKPVAWALTEPRGGSDARGMETRAKRSGNGFLIKGTKTFITHGFTADYIVLMAKTEKGITAFLVDGGSDGLTREPIKGKLGTRGPDTATLSFDDVFVPETSVLGEEGRGFEQAMELLDGGRIAVGAMGVGIARRALSLSVGYAKQREAFGSKIAGFEGIRFGLAELETSTEASALLVKRAAELRDSGQPHRKIAAMAKYLSSQVAMEATRYAIQVHGGYGYFRGSVVERMYRDAKLLEIGEGTNEVLKLVISSEMFR